MKAILPSLLIGTAVLTSPAMASVIPFDPDGSAATNGPQAVSGVTFARGNALARGVVPFSPGAMFQFYQHMSLAFLRDPEGNPVTPVGLNANFEITAVTSVTYIITSVTSAGPARTITAVAAPVQSPDSFVEIWYDPTPDANALSGNGYNDGQRVLLAVPKPSGGATFVEQRDSNGASQISVFDQFGVNNYPGVSTIRAFGNATLSATVTFRDPTFFAVPMQSIEVEAEGLATPFDATNPSALFAGSAGGSAPSLSPNLGSVNGLAATDFQLQNNSGASFTELRLVVTTTADHDDGVCAADDCTLREAIRLANAEPGLDPITFTAGVKGTINLTAALPNLSTDLFINGPGANLLTVRRDTGGDYRIFTVSNGLNNGTGPSVTIVGLTIANGKASGASFPGNTGGGIFNDHGTLTLTNCTISDNTAPGQGFAGGSGGGIYNGGTNSGKATLVVNNSTISNNSAAFFGGGIASDGTINGNAIATLTNCTFAGNSCSNGGALANLGASNGNTSLAVRSSTFAGNDASFGGAVYADAQDGGTSATNIRNSILANGSGDNFSVNNGAAVTSGGHNISSDPAGGDANKGLGGFLSGTGDKRNTNPQLDAGGLKFNGGQTNTIAIQRGSPALHAAVGAPARDQRNAMRNGAADIGAFEFAGSPLRADFNGDAFADFLLFNKSTRVTAIWHLRRNTLLSAVYGPTIAAGYSLITTADLNVDGSFDYVLFNPSTRRTAVWFLRNNTLLQGRFGPSIPSGWELIGMADFNLDHRPDFVLFNASTRQTAVWFLNGASVLSTSYGPTLPEGFRLVDAVDFNANGRPDLLLLNPSTRATQVRFLNGVTQVSSAAGPNLEAGWQLPGVGDFNFDGKPDLVLFHPTTRRTVFWHLNGVAFASSAAGPTLASGFELISP